MFRRELFLIGATAAAIFLAVAAGGWWTVRELRQTARMLVVDTLPGLVDTGLAQERMNDNRRAIRDLLDAPASERSRMIAQVRSNSTQMLWTDYANSIFEAEDRQNYQTLVLARSNYSQSCESYFNLVQNGKMDQAAAFFKGELSERFQNYNHASKVLFEYNERQGVDRGRIILHSASRAPWVIAAVCVAVFGLGFVVGLRGAFTGLDLIFRRKNKTAPKLQ